MVVRVSEHEPQRTMSLDEVKQDITSQLQADKAQQAALVYADELLAALQAGNEISGLLAERSLVWEKSEKLGRFDSSVGNNVVEQAFSLGLNLGENVTTVAKADGNVALVELLSVAAPEAI